ncbi:aspartyl protease family protein [Baaleninema sp.]|uniref:aspartyl protease family protein n=1 Tax=Baaleninema sp. TaxID=3101197 RepID=UPI003CFCCD06
MGQVTTTVTIVNRLDQGAAKRGLISHDRIRSVTLENLLVDTGATTLCLPKPVIETLGLDLLREVTVQTATGLETARIFQDAKISVLGREGTFDCLELPGGRDPLLGVIPLEALGIELDLQKQELVLLPTGPDRSYMTIY